MFKFSFNNTENSKESEINDVEWEESQEIILNLKHSQMDPNNVKTKKIICGNKDITLISSIDLVQQELKNRSVSILLAEERHSDLLPGVYEGGLKIWECTYDLLDYLSNISDLHWENKTILDLGCGAGLLGLSALVNGAKVTFQDYNPEVLEYLTGPNVKLNVSNEEIIEKVRFFSGDWLSFSHKLYQEKPDGIFDVILSSETIYNPLSYDKLHTVFLQLLTKNGIIYIAGKSVYFGVGGTMHGFIEFVKSKKKFDIEICWSNKDGLSREICRLKLQPNGQEIK